MSRRLKPRPQASDTDNPDTRFVPHRRVVGNACHALPAEILTLSQGGEVKDYRPPGQATRAGNPSQPGCHRPGGSG